jgi:hypothetical protein
MLNYTDYCIVGFASSIEVEWTVVKNKNIFKLKTNIKATAHQDSQYFLH